MNKQVKKARIWKHNKSDAGWFSV